MRMQNVTELNTLLGILPTPEVFTTNRLNMEQEHLRGKIHRSNPPHPSLYGQGMTPQQLLYDLRLVHNISVCELSETYKH